MKEKEILAAIEIVSHEIRFVLAEFHNGKLNILHVDRVKHQGIRGVQIVNESKIVTAIKTLTAKASMVIGVKIHSVLLVVPSDNFTITTRRIRLVEATQRMPVTAAMIKNAYQHVLKTPVDDALVVVNGVISRFNVDGVLVKKLSQNQAVSNVTMDVDLLCAQKETVYSYAHCVEMAGLNIIDISLDNYTLSKEAALFEQARSNFILSLNIQRVSTTLSLLNRGKITSGDIVPYGLNMMINKVSNEYQLPSEVVAKLMKYHIQIDNDEAGNEAVYLWSVDEQTRSISERQMIESVKPMFYEYLDSIKEICKDILSLDDISIVVSGEGAQITDIDKMMNEYLQVPTTIYIPETLGARDSSLVACLGMFYTYKDMIYLKSAFQSSVDITEYDAVMNSHKAKTEDLTDSFTNRFKGLFERIAK